MLSRSFLVYAIDTNCLVFAVTSIEPIVITCRNKEIVFGINYYLKHIHSTYRMYKNLHS